jgi:hypothetical protein
MQNAAIKNTANNNEGFPMALIIMIRSMTAKKDAKGTRI